MVRKFQGAGSIQPYLGAVGQQEVFVFAAFGGLFCKGGKGGCILWPARPMDQPDSRPDGYQGGGNGKDGCQPSSQGFLLPGGVRWPFFLRQDEIAEFIDIGQ